MNIKSIYERLYFDYNYNNYCMNFFVDVWLWLCIYKNQYPCKDQVQIALLTFIGSP